MASLVNVNMWLTKADVRSSVLQGAATGTKWIAALGTVFKAMVAWQSAFSLRFECKLERDYCCSLSVSQMVATVVFRDPTFAFVSSWALKAISSFDATKCPSLPVLCALKTNEQHGQRADSV